jgi:ABC-type phosphate transport system substrate-binding protein
MVVGPVAFSYNLKGVSKLVLNGDVLAKIFMGQITTWNDPAIAALNSGATLPTTAIKVFYRSDDSGTTDNVSKYLKANAPSVWTADHSKTWKGKGGEGKTGSAGVAQAVAATDGALGYLEWGFATDNKLGIAQLDAGSGASRSPLTASARPSRPRRSPVRATTSPCRSTTRRRLPVHTRPSSSRTRSSAPPVSTPPRRPS